MDYRRMYDDSEWLKAWDLEDMKTDLVVQIESVTPGQGKGEGNRTFKKPVLSFVGKVKKLAICKTDGKTIAGMYSKDTRKWPGKWIALYVTTTQVSGETKDCLRVRPMIPKGRDAGRSKPKPDPSEHHIDSSGTEMSQDEIAEIEALEKQDVQ